jgi:hypothetical protein
MEPGVSGRDVLDDSILAIATVLAAIGLGGLILDEVRAARAGGRGRFSANLGWTLLWAIGLTVLFAAAWVSRR